METILRELTIGGRTSHRVCQDAYLGALASAGGMRMITFDRGFRSMPGVDAVILTQAR